MDVFRKVCRCEPSQAEIPVHRNVSIHTSPTSGLRVESERPRSRIHWKLHLDHRKRITSNDQFRDIKRPNRNASRATRILHYARKRHIGIEDGSLLECQLFRVRPADQFPVRNQRRHQQAMGWYVHERWTEVPSALNLQRKRLQREPRVDLAQAPWHQCELGILRRKTAL